MRTLATWTCCVGSTAALFFTDATFKRDVMRTPARFWRYASACGGQSPRRDAADFGSIPLLFVPLSFSDAQTPSSGPESP